MTSLNRPLRPVVEVGQTWVNSLGRKFVVESIVKTDTGLIARCGGVVMYLACDGRPISGDWKLVSWDIRSGSTRDLNRLKLASISVERILRAKDANRRSSDGAFTASELEEAVHVALEGISALLDEAIKEKS